MKTKLTEEIKSTQLSRYSPVNGYVVLEVPVVNEKTKAGLTKPQSMIEEEKNELHKYYLKVVKSGLSTYEVGDMVMVNPLILMHNQYAPLIFDKKNYAQVRDSDIIGIYTFE